MSSSYVDSIINEARRGKHAPIKGFMESNAIVPPSASSRRSAKLLGGTSSTATSHRSTNKAAVTRSSAAKKLSTKRDSSNAAVKIVRKAADHMVLHSVDFSALQLARERELQQQRRARDESESRPMHGWSQDDRRPTPSSYEQEAIRYHQEADDDFPSFHPHSHHQLQQQQQHRQQHAAGGGGHSHNNQLPNHRKYEYEAEVRSNPRFNNNTAPLTDAWTVKVLPKPQTFAEKAQELRREHQQQPQLQPFSPRASPFASPRGTPLRGRRGSKVRREPHQQQHRLDDLKNNSLDDGLEVEEIDHAGRPFHDNREQTVQTSKTRGGGGGESSSHSPPVSSSGWGWFTQRDQPPQPDFSTPDRGGGGAVSVSRGGWVYDEPLYSAHSSSSRPVQAERRRRLDPDGAHHFFPPQRDNLPAHASERRRPVTTGGGYESDDDDYKYEGDRRREKRREEQESVVVVEPHGQEHASDRGGGCRGGGRGVEQRKFESEMERQIYEEAYQRALADIAAGLDSTAISVMPGGGGGGRGGGERSGTDLEHGGSEFDFSSSFPAPVAPSTETTAARSTHKKESGVSQKHSGKALPLDKTVKVNKQPQGVHSSQEIGRTAANTGPPSVVSSHRSSPARGGHKGKAAAVVLGGETPAAGRETKREALVGIPGPSAGGGKRVVKMPFVVSRVNQPTNSSNSHAYAAFGEDKNNNKEEGETEVDKGSLFFRVQAAMIKDEGIEVRGVAKNSGSKEAERGRGSKKQGAPQVYAETQQSMGPRGVSGGKQSVQLTEKKKYDMDYDEGEEEDTEEDDDEEVDFADSFADDFSTFRSTNDQPLMTASGSMGVALGEYSGGQKREAKASSQDKGQYKYEEYEDEEEEEEEEEYSIISEDINGEDDVGVDNVYNPVVSSSSALRLPLHHFASTSPVHKRVAHRQQRKPGAAIPRR